MQWVTFRNRLQALLRYRTGRSELDEELSIHLELQTRKHIAQGMDAQEARRLARIEFGAMEQVREECDDVDHWRWIDALSRNTRQCLRSLAKSPGFVAVAIFILTVGIGSNIAVFSTIDALFLRPLPVERPDQLVQIVSVGKDGRTGNLFSPVLDELAQDRAFQGACGFGTSYLAVEINGTLRTLGMAAFSGGCFKTLGLSVQLGRALTPADDHIGAEPVAVITDSLWQREFAGRPDVLGQSIRIGTDVFRIVGVTGKRFTGLLLGFPEPIMLPLLQQPDLLPGGAKPTSYYVNVLARRAPGVSQAQALASVAAEKERLLEASAPRRFNATQRKEYTAQGLTLVSAQSGVDYFLRRRFAQPLFAVFGLCGAMLLMACVNLSSLLLARNLSRQREVAIRLALGSGAGHIAGLFVLENLVLVFAGTVFGIIAGFWAARVILARGGAMFGNFDLPVGLDFRLILFVFVAVLCVIAAFCLASLWQARRLANADALKQSGRGVIAPNSSAQKILLGVQIALTLALVTGSALFGVSARNMRHIDFGINPQKVWEALLAPRPGGYRNPDYWNAHASAYYRDLLQRIETLPNTTSASLSDTIPFLQGGGYREPLAMVDGSNAGRELQVQTLGGTDNYLTTLGAKLISGEDFRRNDNLSGDPSVILTESLAQHLGDPRTLLGHHVRIGTQADWQHLKVIGIASDMDMNLADLNNTRPFTALVDFWQHRTLQGYPVLLIKTRSAALDATTIRRIVEKQGHEYVERFSNVDSEIDHALIENLFLAYLSAAFGAMALLMAAVGLFGLLSYQVANRTAEIGVRMALGAKQAQIRWLVFGQTVRVLMFGSIAGLAMTLAVQKLIAGLLFGVTTYNPLILISAMAVLTSAALVAAWIPTQRASRIDPLEALRHE